MILLHLKKIVFLYFDEQVSPLVLNKALKALRDHLGLILDLGQLIDTRLELLTLDSRLFKQHNRAEVLLLGLQLHLVLLLFLCRLIELADLFAQVLQVIPVFVVAMRIQTVALNFDARLDARQRLRHNRPDHKKYLSEADGVL